MTTALAAGAFISTPAFADGPHVVNTYDELQAALGQYSDIQLGQTLDSSSSSTTPYLDITTDTTLDLNGFQLGTRETEIQDGVDFTVIDSTATDSASGTGLLSISADGLNSDTAVYVGNGSTFHVTGAEMYAQGVDGGAGIGSAYGTAASFVADDNASVESIGDSSTSTLGGAGIGGPAGQSGITVTIDDASVHATGGIGAAGIGGGEGGAGGAVALLDGAHVDAEQGGDDGIVSTPASSFGAGQDGTGFGSLSIGSDTYVNFQSNYPLHLPAGATVENHGTVSLFQANGFPGAAVTGAGTIHNLGTVQGSVEDAQGDSNPVDPTTLVDSGVKFTGYNYNVALDGNGGTVSSSKPTSGHVLSATASDLVGQNSYDYTVTASSDAYGFYAFNTQANGSGTNVDMSYGVEGNLAGLGTSSDGIPVPVSLYAQYARIPYATSANLPDATVGTPYRATLPIAGDGLNSFWIYSSTDPDNPIPGLPAGLSLDTATGVISGTPTEAVERDLYVEAGGLLYSNGISIHISVGGVPVFGTSSLPAGMVGSAYSSSVVVSGGPATYSVVAGALPAGLTLNSTTGAITGTPTGSSTASLTIRATNRYGSADHAYGLSIAAAAVSAPAPAKPVVTAIPKTTVKFGHALTLAVTANSTLPVTFRLSSGSLPKGITLNTTSGLISGTADATGTFTAEVTATSTAGSATTKVVLVVPAVQQLIDTKGSVPAVKAGAGTVPVKVTGFKKGEKWTVRVDGKLVQHGTMKKSGSISVKVHLAKAKKDKVHTIRIAGSRKVTDPAKTASTTITVTSLAIKKTLRVQTVSANGVKLVAVEKLAAGERVVVKDGKKVIAKGHANAYGIFAFPQAKAGKGTSKLTVQGAAVKRAGTLTVKNPKR